MWNSGLRIIWFRLYRDNGRGFHLHFPISLNVLMELIDSLLDIMTLICALTPKTSKAGSRISVRATRELILMLMALLSSITDEGPYDLVDVAAGNVKVSIKIR